MDAKDDERRATFIVRLARDARESSATPWHGVVELVDGRMKRRISGPDDLAAFIDSAFADPPRPAPSDRAGQMGGKPWN